MFIVKSALYLELYTHTLYGSYCGWAASYQERIHQMLVSSNVMSQVRWYRSVFTTSTCIEGMATTVDWLRRAGAFYQSRSIDAHLHGGVERSAAVGDVESVNRFGALCVNLGADDR